MAGAGDGSLSLGFGLGKYPNRGVMDAYAGVSRGTEQWTVRASRELGADGDTTAVGPMRYEVLEPMQRIRFALDANDAQPISFEWIFEGAVPAVLENHEVHRARDGRRVDADIARYHHIGTAHGWVEVDGERTEFADDTWVSTRDHSWGVRYQVGVPADRPRARTGPDERRDDGDLVADPHDPRRRHALRPAHLLPAPRASATGSASSCRAASSTPTGGASRTPRSFPSSTSTR